MIEDVDETLRKLLIREMPIKNGEIDITFDQPTREWSARLNRPTLNIFMHNLQENVQLRHRPGWVVSHDNGQATKTRAPLRVDLQYMITAWATEPEDEHRLLARALMALARYILLPEDLLSTNLQNQPFPVPIEIAQPGDLQNAADIWSVMDNELRPAIPCNITIALDPYQPVTGPAVRIWELRFGQFAKLPSLTQDLAEASAQTGPFWTIGGTLHSEKPLEDIRLILVEQGKTIPLQPEGRFVVSNLRAGNYTLEVSVKGRKPKQHKISVPAPDYDINI
jgi:hypothetical protein